MHLDYTVQDYFMGINIDLQRMQPAVWEGTVTWRDQMVVDVYISYRGQYLNIDIGLVTYTVYELNYEEVGKLTWELIRPYFLDALEYYEEQTGKDDFSLDFDD